jgi:tRNA G10  N-methylase Trm11
MKQFFILGRNPLLSKEEIFAYARARKIQAKEVFLEGNLLVLELNEEIPIQELGGTIKSGKISFEGAPKDFEKYVDKNELVPADKFSYAVYGNIDPEILKEKFKADRKKTSLKHGRRKIELQDGEKAQNPNADFDILLTSIQNKVYFGVSDQEYSYSHVKSRDMAKPIRREALAISPRLAKILINLSEAKPGDTLLDPFCGVGAILAEALVQKINVHGIDKDAQAIQGAEQNLNWLKKNFPISTSWKIEVKDSRFAPKLQFDAVATETPLGKVLTRKPTENEARKIIQDFEALIIPILARLKEVKKPYAKIAITFPSIGKNRVSLTKIAERTGLRVARGPLLESRADQNISREILVFE